MKKVYMFIALLLLLFVVGCSKDKEEPTLEKSDPREKETPEAPESSNVYPLTGIETNEDTTDRAIGVMVNNHPAARPHSGLSKADIVFEILAEGGITRFLALFQSEQPDVVGPVRSAREYYFELAQGYDALYTYHGAADFVNDMIQTRGIEHLNGAIYDDDGHLFKRESFRKAPHNSYFIFDNAYDVAVDKGYETTSTIDPLPFVKEEENIEGDSAIKVTVTYPGRNASDVIEYFYEESNERYIRYDNDEQTVELNTEEAVEVDNLFIVEAYHEVFDSEGRRKVDLKDSGNAFLIQKGKLQQLQWKNENGRIIPVKDGRSVGFIPGKTWVNIVPTDPGIEQSVQFSNE